MGLLGLLERKEAGLRGVRLFQSFSLSRSAGAPLHFAGRFCGARGGACILRVCGAGALQGAR